MSGVPYDDGRIACADDALVIRNYYFPPRDKRIPYSAISQVRKVPLASLAGAVKGYGSGDFVHWFNYDPGRRKKTAALVIEISGRRVKPVITPDNADDVAAELAGRGVNVAP